MISVLILTKNEEQNILACLESVSWSDDITVLDDLSSDRTVDIARQFGAKVICHSAGGERAQRSYALSEIPFKYEWVYNPDADEVTPAELREEMLQAVAAPDQHAVAFRVRFKNIFMGRWVKRASLYPTWVVRLYKPACVSFAREINLQYKINGPEGRLQNHFLHYSFNKGLTEWFAKHNRYSELEAREAKKCLDGASPGLLAIVLNRDPVVRRRLLKNFAWRLPMRFLLVFFYLLVIRRGMLDGQAGIHYCMLRAIYEYMIDVKIMEASRRHSNLRTTVLADD